MESIASVHSAFYSAPVNAFLAATDEAIYAPLAGPHGYTLRPEQLAAWHQQLPVLRTALAGVDGWVHLEFDIPRLGRRVDAVLVTDKAVVPIEFKVGAKKFEQLDYEQAWDYGLDLKNFHAPSHAAPIFPILCATEAAEPEKRWRRPHADGVRPPFCANAETLNRAIQQAIHKSPTTVVDPATWGRGNYSPTPTIIEAARSLYARHTVHDITRNDAGATNLAATSDTVEQIVADAKARGRKAIVFVTGVPGAGKTLVGLNVATRHGERTDSTHAVFLSGNGPLVAVLREALARDELSRRQQQHPKTRIGECRTAVKAFIQNVHHFRDDTIRTTDAPVDHVVVFDEAQRAWNAQMLGNFMKRKKGMTGFTQSEPELLIGSMDRHADWAVVVCLVGGGQEINTGEAGIGEWLDSVRKAYPTWDVHISPHLTDSEYAAVDAIHALAPPSSLPSENNQAGSPTVSRTGVVARVPALHLSTSMRSFRAENLSRFVKALLDGAVDEGRELLQQFKDDYPIVVTRSMKDARRWIRRQRRGTERAGIVASSSAQRLKPHAIDIRVNINPVHWFLSPPKDTRSSQYLEDAATEFQVQGLELDWTIVTWDADLRWSGEDWTYHSFRGAKWTNVKKPERQQYLKNAYRVLLTRARQGMVIFVPPGTKRDKTRNSWHYDETNRYLMSLGVTLV